MVEVNPIRVFGVKKIPFPFVGTYSPKFLYKW